MENIPRFKVTVRVNFPFRNQFLSFLKKRQRRQVFFSCHYIEPCILYLLFWLRMLILPMRRSQFWLLMFCSSGIGFAQRTSEFYRLEFLSSFLFLSFFLFCFRRMHEIWARMLGRWVESASKKVLSQGRLNQTKQREVDTPNCKVQGPARTLSYATQTSIADALR